MSVVAATRRRRSQDEKRSPVRALVCEEYERYQVQTLYGENECDEERGRVVGGGRLAHDVGGDAVESGIAVDVECARGDHKRWWQSVSCEEQCGTKV
mmetsp:Transcript_35071/g.113548  ORF Transcript_35071/g.113548 Transcript_35071/m.113548 type:complete len:97 (+) Transcript_35071:175-465(+)